MSLKEETTYEVGQRYLFRTSGKYHFGTITNLTDAEIMVKSASLMLKDEDIEAALKRGDQPSGRALYNKVIFNRDQIIMAIQVPALA